MNRAFIPVLHLDSSWRAFKHAESFIHNNSILRILKATRSNEVFVPLKTCILLFQSYYVTGSYVVNFRLIFFLKNYISGVGFTKNLVVNILNCSGLMINFSRPLKIFFLNGLQRFLKFEIMVHMTKLYHALSLFMCSDTSFNKFLFTEHLHIFLL